MYDTFRGINWVESVHKDPIAIVRWWNNGVKMPVALLGERRHRHNQRVANRCRLGYPKISHYDPWLIEEFRLLYESNRGSLLYPNVTNSSQYISMNESFDAAASNFRLWQRTSLVLAGHQDQNCHILPFPHVDKQIKYAEYAKDSFPVNCVAAAV